MKLLMLIAILMLSLLFLSCANKTLEGVYIGNENAFYDQLIFKSNNKVEVVFMGATSEADYIVEADKVKITSAGQTQVLAISKSNCLDGGGFIGKYYKE